MNVVVTGSKGFIGKNLVAALKNEGIHEILEYDVETPQELLDRYCMSAEFVFHLAGINRPDDPAEYRKGNLDLTRRILANLRKYGNTCPVMIASSVQATLSNPYGESKKAAEEILERHGEETGAKVLIYRFPNVFGKWCRPNYNSVVATFCNNVARGLPIIVNDEQTFLQLVYIDDLIHELVRAIDGHENRNGPYCEVGISYPATVGGIAERINSFKSSRETLEIPDMSDPLTKKLYSTYLSYLPEDRFSYPLLEKTDARGSFTEFIRTIDRGQISVNRSKPGIVKGNHWHQSKNEKFLVVSGEGIIRLRQVHADTVVSYKVSAQEMTVVDIPPGYTHTIENTGIDELVMLIWANEPFDPNDPDTYPLEV